MRLNGLVEQGLSLKSLRKQAKGADLFPVGNGGPRKKTWLVHVSGGSPPRTPMGRLDVEEAGVGSPPIACREKDWEISPNHGLSQEAA